MEQYHWDRQLMWHALQVAEDSNCARRGVGIVISLAGDPVVTSFNGTLTGEMDCNLVFDGPVVSDEDRAEHKEFTRLNEIHAEQSAVAEAAKNGINIQGAEAHLNLIPCLPCLFTLVEAGVSRIVFLEDRKDVTEDHKKANVKERLKKIGVELVGPTSGELSDPRSYF